MTVKSAIQEALHKIYDEGEANACAVYKGTDYDGAFQATGWWVRPFNRQPIFLGKNKAEALAMIEDIASLQEAEHPQETWKIYAQNPEHYDTQGIYVKAEGEDPPWQTETDCEEFDGFNDPGETGILIRDLESAQKWAAEVYCLRGEVTEFEVYPT